MPVTFTALTIKIVSFFVFPIIVACSAIPAYRLKHKEDAATPEYVLSYANCIAGGFILGFGLLHILPDGVGDYASSSLSTATGQYPVPYAVAVWSFVLMIVLEKVVAEWMTGFTNLSTGHADEKVDAGESLPSINPKVACHDNHIHSHALPTGAKSSAAAYLFVFGLSIHSIFEGLAIGLSTDAYGALLVFFGIALHKSAEGFAFGLNAANAKISTSHFYAMLVAVMVVVPIGVAIGLGVLAATGANDNKQSTASGILNGFAAGIFLYISILGIMIEEFAKCSGRDAIIKAAMLLTAATAMGFISFLE